MENGGQRGCEKSCPEQMDAAAAGGNSLPELANGDTHASQGVKCLIEDVGEGEVDLGYSGQSKVEPKDSDEGEVFEEAIGDIEVQQRQWQSGPSENEQATCAVDNDDDGGGMVPEENQNPSLAHDSENIDQPFEKFDEAKDAQIEEQTSELTRAGAGEAMFFDRKVGSGEVPCCVPEEEVGKEAELRCVDDVVIDSGPGIGVVTEECGSFLVDGGETKSDGDVVEKPDVLDFATNGAPGSIQENGEYSEVIADERGTSELNGLIPCHSEMPQTQEAVSEKDASLDKETEGLQCGNVDSLQDIAEKDDAVQAGACQSSVETSDVKQSQFLAKSREQKQEEDGERLDVRSQVQQEFTEDTVTVEDLDESSSSGEDESSTSVDPPPATTSSLKKSSGPSLPSQPAGLGSSAPLLEPVRSFQPPRANGSSLLRQSQVVDDPANGDAEENDETREKLQMIRVKFLRLAHRLGQTPHNVVVAQVLYRLGLAEQLRGSRSTNRAGAFSFDRASAMAEHLEAAGQEPLDFSCTILVIGKTGVGKSSTINSIFDEFKFGTNAFQPGTKKVQDIVGTVQGIKVRVIDTPGLSSSSSDQRKNEKILHSVKHFIKKSPPDIVLYLDRLDMQSRDYGDVPLLRSITDIFGTSIWFNAIVVLTHAASAPPDGVNGTPLSYEMFVTQRSHVVQQAIRQAAGDMRLMNPVSLVENHSACRMNRAGQRVLPNGQVWKPQLLLLSFASKILAEANELLKLQDNPPGKPFTARARIPPLPFLLSSLLQSRPQLKLPEEQFGDDDSMEEDGDDTSDSDDESEYDELPPFKRLTRAQLAMLSRAQRKAYYEELDYREKLFYKKQLKEEKRRRRLLKKLASSTTDVSDDYNSENVDDESSSPASVAVPMADLVLPASFDSDYPSHRYRFLDSSSKWIVRPVLETQGWDHDVGYEGLNAERMFAVKEKIPVSVSGQLSKDKKEFTLQMEMASSIKHGEGKATSLGLDMQTVGKDVAYTLRGETEFNNFSWNNTAAGVSVTRIGDALSAGLKIEDKLVLNKRFRLVVNGGAMTGRGDVAYGGRMEATLRDKDYPLGRTLTTLALSIVDWHGDLAIGGNFQSQFPIGRHTNLIGHANLSNRGTGQVGIRVNSSEQLQIALVALIPILKNIQRMLFGSFQPT
uniref:Translocase of chloroplast 132, chloroplastic n=1 Tax=Anthurium amnicola TaxID=1678845 RepID=A0A1D1Z7H2_9ARAE